MRYVLENDATDVEDYFAHKPFVDWTSTTDSYLRKGFGTRRLKVMNQFSLKTYGHPLYSSTNVTKEAQEVWKQLVSQGLAEKFLEGTTPRYCFLTEPPPDQAVPMLKST